MQQLITPLPGESLLELGKRCNAVYLCPKDGTVRLGPLVAYAGKDSQNRNLVGDIYFNFRRIEPHLEAVEAYAWATYQNLHKRGLLGSFDAVCGIPNGGRTFGQELARITKKRFVYADKKPKPTDAGKKQEYSWDLSQFDFEPGERIALAEDVYNNFQNTDNTLTEIGATGTNIVVLVGALNRSPVYDMVYKPKSGPYASQEIPIVTSIREAYPEYEQGDPLVADDIAAGRLELDVKKNWGRLCDAMNTVKK